MSLRENLPPHVTTSILKELRQLARNPPDGVRFIPKDEDITEIHAEIEGPEGTPFEGGTWHVKLVLGNEYPASAPKVSSSSFIYIYIVFLLILSLSLSFIGILSYKDISS